MRTPLVLYNSWAMTLYNGDCSYFCMDHLPATPNCCLRVNGADDVLSVAFPGVLLHHSLYVLQATATMCRDG